MCGIFAFAGGGAPHPELLALAATQAARRGPHSHGWAALERTVMTTHHELGPIGDCTSCKADGLRDRWEPRILGHSRLATFGAPDNADGTQPILRDSRNVPENRLPHAIAHNGNAYNAADIDSKLAKTSDTVVLAELYSALRAANRTPSQALQGVVNVADQKAWALVVLDATGELVAHRHGLPLFRLTHPTGVYISSVAFAGAEALPEDVVTREAPAL
jgi:glutamine phosphoribosylpyrophosphate amidotransferase